MATDAIACPVSTGGDPSDWRGTWIEEVGCLSLRAQLSGHTPLANGAAMLLPASEGLAAKYIIVAPDYDGETIAGRLDQFGRWIAAILAACDARGLDDVVIPLRADQPDIPMRVAIETLHSECRAHHSEYPKQITIVGFDGLDAALECIGVGLSDSESEHVENPPLN